MIATAPAKDDPPRWTLVTIIGPIEYRGSESEAFDRANLLATWMAPHPVAVYDAFGCPVGVCLMPPNPHLEEHPDIS